MGEPTIVRLVFDETLPPGKVRLGGVRIVGPEDDAALGRELRTVEVACHPERVENLRAQMRAADGVELEHDVCDHADGPWLDAGPDHGVYRRCRRCEELDWRPEG